ncbi:TetR family transcriptional regulator [Hyphomonas polymorpha PS728]|uniref:TetR family transcriptional regulator n=1 Tax=Hyphomonas polymorpha PS728 TaxID=1280954 RepID=A0A062V8V9_9PROT|nr:TetR/AcrR family transcriptional regulator [Hyphomonas polymorpha]KCZ98652.1 TetR family transcriptional regulator [Hyphomonas polymorpha PS728]
MARKANPQTRDNLMEAAFGLVRRQGLSATSVDEICAAAGVSKGAFFHHFKSKEELAAAAADHWSAVTEAFFETAPYHQPADPLARLLGYIDFRREMMSGEIAEFTCFVGTMAQEAWATSPPVAAATWDSMRRHGERLVPDIEAAMAAHGLSGGAAGGWSAQSLAQHIVAVTQGAFILAKASGDAGPAQASLDHLRRYICQLFEPAA